MEQIHQQYQVYDQALYWYQQGDLLSAEQQLNQLHSRRLQTPQSLQLLGNIHFRQQRLQAAEKAYAAALELDPADSLSWHNLALVRLRLTTATLMSARTQLGRLDAEDERLLTTLLRLQRASLQ
ncbi:MAG: tetratricopeptide repeat protein [Pseudomonadota bacterium]